MGVLNELFENEEFGSKRTIFDDFNERIVKLFRGLDESNGDLRELSDGELANISMAVMATFRTAAERKGEQIADEYLLTIVIKFLLLYKIHGHAFYLEHLKYEIERYIQNGLREDYKRNLY